MYNDSSKHVRLVNTTNDNANPYNDSSKHVRLVNTTNDNARTMDTYQPKFNAILNYGMKFMST
jgi:hypothetical protein